MNPDWKSELEGLLRAAMDGPPEEVDWISLERLLDGNSDAVAVYVDLMTVHALLKWQAGPQTGRSTEGMELEARAPSAASVPLPAPALNRSPVLGFVHSALRSGRQVVARHNVAAALVLLATIVPLFVWLASTPSHQKVAVSKEQGIKTSAAAPSPNSVSPAAELALIARLTRAVDVQWGSGAGPLIVGSELAAGQKLQIESGLAEVVFPKGVNLVLQGPATLTIESGLRVYLAQGRVTARLTSPDARGFIVRTSRSAVIDEGTEFGVDVAPGGDQNVHVFQGKVQFSATSANGKPAVQRQLNANEGTRLRAETGAVDLVAGAGEGFTRSIDKTGHDPHTIAYWRFEDGPVGSLVPDNGLDSKPVRGTADCSGNGNDLFAWSTKTAPRFSGDVAETTVASTGKANRGSLDNSAALVPYAGTRDLYTSSPSSHASPRDVQKISPRQWTVEASVKPAKLPHKFQVFVGRDGREPWIAGQLPPRLALAMNAQDHFMVRFLDGDGRRSEAVAGKLALRDGHWYYVAATSDGRALQLYVDVLDGKGYRLQATSNLPATGNTALGCGSEKAEWSIGRGENNNGKPANWFQGWIDEVRISDIARQPSEFLFAPTRVGDVSPDVSPEGGLK